MSVSNRRSKLINSSGHLCTEQKDIENVIYDYYTDLFLTQNPTELTIDNVIQHVKCKVTHEMNSNLSTPFTTEEVRQAIFDMHPSKAPGLDGFNAQFFQDAWGVIEDDPRKSLKCSMKDKV